MKVVVIIPAFNEEQSLPLVLADIPREHVAEIIVVDNASTDHTAEVAERLGARAVREAERGYGAACLRGIAELPPDTDVVVFLDADHSDHAEELPLLLEPIACEGVDLVVGSRMLGHRERGALAPQAYFGNKLAVFLMRLFWGARYTDLGPFRAIRHDALQSLGMRDRNFGWTIEMQIRAHQRELRVTERAVSYRRRIGKSKITGTVTGTVKAGAKIIYTIFKLKLGELLARGQSS